MSSQVLTTTTSHTQELPSPAGNTLLTAAKLAQSQDKPILLDYYADSVIKKAFIGEDKETGDKILVKSRDEYTSLIKKTYKVAEDLLVLTENSIYVIHGSIVKKHIQATKMLQEADDF